MSMADRVDPLSVRTAAADIVSGYPEAESTFHYHQLAALVEYVNDTITYVPDPRSQQYVAPPEETLEVESGDCDCQAVLVASLAEAIGATTRLVKCQSRDGDWHALAEVYLANEGDDMDAIYDSLDRFYGGRPNDGYSWESDGSGRLWFPADTAMGRHVGDVGLLVENGYVTRSADGTWSWHNADHRPV